MTDEARKQYSTYDSYLKRKSSNQYYNLGSINYSKMTANPPTLEVKKSNILGMGCFVIYGLVRFSMGS